MFSLFSLFLSLKLPLLSTPAVVDELQGSACCPRFSLCLNGFTQTSGFLWPLAFFGHWLSTSFYPFALLRPFVEEKEGDRRVDLALSLPHLSSS